MPGALTFAQIDARLCRLRERRRRLGWFDWSSGSYDRRSTAERALRIWLRLQGQREPLRHTENPERAVHWNVYHS